MGPRIPTAATPAAPEAAPGPQTSLDTRHEFHRRITGAPPGTRGEMVMASGPAVATVRTSYALEGV
jgi:hypothetical protein